MRHAETQCIEIEFKIEKPNKGKRIGCISFTNFKRQPFGAFVYYVTLSEKFKTELLDKQFKFRNVTYQLFRKSIGRKLLNMVQLMSWVNVQNISIHLCATKNSLPFYKLLQFKKYDLKFLNLPVEIQNTLQVENINDVGEDLDIYPMFLANQLLSSPGPSAITLLHKYINYLK